MAYPKGLRRWARVAAPTLAAVVGCDCVRAADLGPGPGLPAAPAYGYAGFFYPTLDPRCRIVPMPEASLYGDTARLRPTAVCQSRGLYADSVFVSVTKFLCLTSIAEAAPAAAAQNRHIAQD